VTTDYEVDNCDRLYRLRGTGALDSAWTGSPLGRLLLESLLACLAYDSRRGMAVSESTAQRCRVADSTLCLLFGGFFLLHNLGVIALTFIHPLDLLYAVGLIYVGMMILRGSHVRVQMRSGKHARKKDDWQFHYVSGAARDSQGESSAFADDDGDRDDDASGLHDPYLRRDQKLDAYAEYWRGTLW